MIGYELDAARPWHTKGFSQDAPIVVMAGPEKRAHKSWIALSSAIACVTGLPWLGRFPVKRTGDVVLYDAENGPHRTKRRLVRLCRGYGVNPDDVIPHIHYVYSAGLKLDGRDDSFRAVVTDLEELAKSTMISEVIVDPLANHIAGDENSKEDVLRTMDGLAKMRDGTGAQVLVLHHLNKSGSSSGSRAIVTRADLFIEGSDTNVVRWEAIGRDIRLEDDLSAPFTITTTHTDDSDDDRAATVLSIAFKGNKPGELSETAKLALSTLQTKGPMSQTRLRNEIKQSSDGAKEVLAELQAAGLIMKSGPREWAACRGD